MEFGNFQLIPPARKIMVRARVRAIRAIRVRLTLIALISLTLTLTLIADGTSKQIEKKKETKRRYYELKRLLTFFGILNVHISYLL